jgi:hypothetical protein
MREGSALYGDGPRLTLYKADRNLGQVTTLCREPTSYSTLRESGLLVQAPVLKRAGAFLARPNAVAGEMEVWLDASDVFMRCAVESFLYDSRCWATAYICGHRPGRRGPRSALTAPRLLCRESGRHALALIRVCSPRLRPVCVQNRYLAQAVRLSHQDGKCPMRSLNSRLI